LACGFEPGHKVAYEKTKLRKPTRSSFPLLSQLGNLIQAHHVPQLARDTGVEEKSRTFTP
jgi:hypothetical protein